ncbi:MarR family EPS-associated transcriptional regulator [Pelomonas sp. SE-A7]|uniref:MarR family EPS-associated transcriptional regulator n=1 Tax=Pelomonas sp. SE-A7 TaxID=3054953 RepID=UPI00259D0EAB|nr:MarR family EPS-associated transcriptional regulator [Pelomonas sp. SE-A7]MDM4767504.1 MarR family EPS-associated transcriptional regulator [Pelomonas sp. SE-A7]
MNTPPSDDELELAAMRAVAGSPPSSQRELAATLGISLGKTNYLLRALLEKGLVKVENFSRSDNKLGYLYLLTPSGVVEKTRLTRAFLTRKEAEYLQLQQQIHALRSEVDATAPSSARIQPDAKRAP